MITLDKTAYSVVVVCSCGWRHLTDSERLGWVAAREHEKSVHPEEIQARAAYRSCKRRT